MKDFDPKDARKGKLELKRPLRTFILLVVGLVFSYILFRPVRAVGRFETTTFDDGQVLLTESVSLILGDPKIGDIVVFKASENPDRHSLGVIIGIDSQGEENYIVSSKKGLAGQTITEKQIKRRSFFIKVTNSELLRLQDIDKARAEEPENAESKGEENERLEEENEGGDVKLEVDSLVSINEGNREVIDSRHGYSFIYPENWVVYPHYEVEYTNDRTGFSNEGVSSPMALSEKGIYGWIDVKGYEFIDKNIFDSGITEYVEDNFTTIKKLGNIASGNMSFVKFTRIKSQDWQGGTGPTIYYAYNRNANKVYTIGFHSPSQVTLDTNIGVLESVVRSFRILDN